MFKAWKVIGAVIVVASLLVQGYMYNVSPGQPLFDKIINTQQYIWWALIAWVVAGAVLGVVNWARRVGS